MMIQTTQPLLTFIGGKMFPEWYIEFLELCIKTSGANEDIPSIIYLAYPTIVGLREILEEHKEPRRAGDLIKIAKEALGNMVGHRMLCENKEVNGAIVTTKGGIFYIQTGGFSLK